MSSLTSGICATPALQRFLDEARAGQHRDVAVVRVQIRGEDLVETARRAGTADGDLSQLEEYLDANPALFLLRASASSWYVVLWMPEGKVGPSNRMVYAASQPKLKEAVGAANIAGALQFSTVDEVLGGGDAGAAPGPETEPEPKPEPAPDAGAKDAPPSVAPKPPGLQATRSFSQVSSTTTTTTVQYERVVERRTQQQAERQGGPPAIAPKPQGAAAHRGVFVRKADPRLAMSSSELKHVDVLQQEDEARSEQLAQMHSRLRAGAAPAKAGPDPSNQHASSMGIKETAAAASGGFHTVTLPLSADAKDALGSFASTVGTTVVELQVEANKCVSSTRSFASTEDFVPNASEPRFYVMRTPGSRAFVYSCPESSPARLRMVYSTASASTLEQIQALGCKITHRLSLFSPKECTLVAVAATIRTGQAQRVCDSKAVSEVVAYVPSTPARSLPTRFAVTTTRPLDAFTNEDGFRKAFSSVRPDAPEPAPFKSPDALHRPQAPSPAPHSDAVDTSPNAGAAAWGLQLRSSTGTRRTVVTQAASASTGSGGAAPAVTAAVSSREATGSPSLPTRFSQTRLAGEAGDESSADGASRWSSPRASFVDAKSCGAEQRAESVRSSLPGLRPVADRAHDSSRNSTPASDRDAKWDPWRPVSSTTKTSASKQDAPKSALQSSVFTKDSGPVASTIADLMGDITYPPLQQAAGSGASRAAS
ncbi:hypothetical protein H4R18_000077 [Coemansia javaensis]|uniref:ADF-H domain-containing protein n=1 Tax=Coemansia javaensis TaxID=2761396 RepID=A0A9W8HJ62_9FUNG|nr:hypothetical protein H4R18_000077 [Coemansia javaensis]